MATLHAKNREKLPHGIMGRLHNLPFSHRYFPQTVYRFRHIWHGDHAILWILELHRHETGSELYRTAVWDILETISRLLLALVCLRGKLGQNSSLKTHSPIVHFDDPHPVPNGTSKWSMMTSELKVSKTICCASLRREN